MEQKLLKAVNEIYERNFKKLDDCLDEFTQSEIIEAFLLYHGILGYSEDIREAYEIFYHLIPKSKIGR